ncbi:MAG: HAMP domain-containing sensor histidine kinase [Candidatus Cybelea sp.]
MPESFAPFARRLTNSYVLLALALIAVVVTATSLLAFFLYVGTLNEAVATDAHRAAQRALSYEGLHEPLRQYAPALAGEIGGSRVSVRVYDEQRNLLVGSDRVRGSSTGRFTRVAAAVFGLHPAVVRVASGTIVVTPDLQGFVRLLERYLAFVLPIGALAVLAAWLIGRAITRRAIAPLQEVASALRRIAAGDFAPEPLPASASSLRELTAAYNEVARGLTVATTARERNELQMRQFVADAGHELRTPLTIVMGYLEILKQGVVGDPAGVAHVYDTMLAESRRMRAAIEKLIFLARLERPAASRLERVDLASVAAHAAEELQPLAGSGRIVLTAPSSPCNVEADEGELYEAIKNVIENAVRYAPDSPIAVDLCCVADGATLIVSDGGPGMEARDVEHAFDRFYRGGERRGEGSGLGLPIAKRAVERLGGTILLDSRPGAGTTVTISLPHGSRPP